MTFLNPTLLFVVSALMVPIAILCLRRHAYKLAAIFVLTSLLSVAAGMANAYDDIVEENDHTFPAIYFSGEEEHLRKRYEAATTILSEAEFSKPDKAQIGEAVSLLEDFTGNGMSAQMKEDCPNAEVLLTYAMAMEQVASYSGHMTNQDVSENSQLVSLVLDLPEGYQGKLAKKITPFRTLILAMDKEGKREVVMDAENALKYAQNLREGRYGKIRPGDSEESIPAAMGKPSRVNTTQGGGQELKQYVFNHDGKTSFVYTKDGIVTGVQ